MAVHKHTRATCPPALRGGRPHRGVLVLPWAPSTYERTATDAYLAMRYSTTGDGRLVPHPGVYPLEVEGVVIARLDMAYPSELVFVESDGFGFHSLPSQLRRDHVRANEIVARTEWKGVRVGKRERRGTMAGPAATGGRPAACAPAGATLLPEQAFQREVAVCACSESTPG